MRTRYLLLALAAVSIGCKGKNEPTGPARLEVSTGSDGQTGPAGAPLPNPLAVTARAADGAAVPRTEVRWTVVEGAGAALSDSVTLADGNGRAEAVLTLGPLPGQYRVRAEIRSLEGSGVVLSATATEAPSLAAVSPTNFAAGDTVTATGSGLQGVTAVEVAGAPAVVVSAGGTSVRFLAPICLAPGPVQVRVRAGAAASNVITATYASSQTPLAMVPGEYASIDPAQLAGCAAFEAAGPGGAQYLVAPQSVTGSPGVTVSYRLAGNSVVVILQPPERVKAAPSRAQRLHDALREQERQASRLPRVPMGQSLAFRGVLEQVQVGDRRAFQVCKSIPCENVGDFAEVTAEAQWVGTHAALFLDQDAPAQGFTPSDFDSLGAVFDDVLYDVDTRAFGAESDVDGNGVVMILFTPQVNALTPKQDCGTSIFTGYFFGVDIDPSFQNDPRSNRGEVFYTLAPDPAGSVTCSFSTSVVRRLVPVTFVHEFQHMISYNQHVVVRGGSAELLWLNEGLSHLAEELAALRFEALGNDTLFSRFAVGNLFNGYLFLENPGASFALPSAGTGGLEERGAGWVLLRYLGDRFGEDIARRLVETNRTGSANVEAVIGRPMAQLLPAWFLAAYVSDLPGFTAPEALRYRTWQFRTTYQSLHDQLPSQFTRVFPIVPQAVSGGTFSSSGTLRSGSGDYFLVTQDPGDQGFTLQLTDAVGQALGGTGVPRLNVIRIR